MLILAVDDEVTNLLAVKAAVMPAGFELIEAQSGGDALAKAREATPDLILLDMQLPDMPGLEVIRNLRESPGGRNVRVIAMSHDVSPRDRTKWLEAGCLGTIEKPLTVRVLKREISRWMRRASFRNFARAEMGGQKSQKLGEILLSNGLVTADQLRRAVAAQEESGNRLGQLLVEQGAVTEDDIAWALSNQLTYPYIFITRDIVDDDAVKLLPEPFIREHSVLPIHKFGEEMTLAMADPTDYRMIDEVIAQTGLRVNPAIALASNIEDITNRIFSRGGPPRETAGKDARYLEFHLIQALQLGASEVHFDTSIDGRSRVRYRLHGVLIDRDVNTPELHGCILEHLRGLTGLDSAAAGTVVTGFTAGNTKTRLMITIMPTSAGQVATVTIYPYRMGTPDLGPLGVDTRTLLALEAAIRARRGVLAVGCGDLFIRSTLIHAILTTALHEKMWTLETLPIYRHPEINQTVVESPEQTPALLSGAFNAGADLLMVDDASRPSILESVLRIGLMRMVVMGHPQDDAAGLLSQLFEAAGQSLVASTLVGLVAARPVRLLCQNCKDVLRRESGVSDGRVTFTAVGCGTCGFTGFRGYRVLTELWIVGPEDRLLLRTGSNEAVFAHVSRVVGASMDEQGLRLLEDGLISMDELSRAVEGV